MNEVEKQRYAPVITAFRSDTEIELPAGFNDEGKIDTKRGDFAAWCATHVGVLERHGLYMEDPSIKRDQPTCVLTATAPADHKRVFFPVAVDKPAEETPKTATRSR